MQWTKMSNILLHTHMMHSLSRTVPDTILYTRIIIIGHSDVQYSWITLQWYMEFIIIIIIIIIITVIIFKNFKN